MFTRIFNVSLHAEYCHDRARELRAEMFGNEGQVLTRIQRIEIEKAVQCLQETLAKDAERRAEHYRGAAE